MWTPDYFIRYIDFPASVEGVTIPNNDGTFDIYINQRLCPKKQQLKLAHEIRHIRNDHFYNDILPIRDIEREADGVSIKPPKRLPDVLFYHPAGKIALFHSLESLGNYSRNYAKQWNRERAMKG
ncbi:hypothetical protein [Oscillibacter sp.]|uniref:hypothetical protein n=1 Tax=Oscillibacter sp. TaxID=1945593 RepID=UPI00289EB603|nr:hypothetical protein [Oscillibacter sp.]